MYYQLVIIEDVDDYKRRGETPSVTISDPVLDIKELYPQLFDKLNEEINNCELDERIPEQYRIEIEPFVCRDGTKVTQYRINPEYKENIDVLDEIWEIVMRGEFVPWRNAYEFNEFSLNVNE